MVSRRDKGRLSFRLEFATKKKPLYILQKKKKRKKKGSKYQRLMKGHCESICLILFQKFCFVVFFKKDVNLIFLN